MSSCTECGFAFVVPNGWSVPISAAVTLPLLGESPPHFDLGSSRFRIDEVQSINSVLLPGHHQSELPTLRTQPAELYLSRLSVVAENDQSLSFVIEATGPVRLRIAPRQWAIHRGREYSVNTSFFGPFMVRAENDNALVFSLDSPRNCTVVVEPLPGTNLLCNGGFAGAEQGGLPRDWELRTEGAPDRNTLHPVTVTTDEPGSNKFLLRIQHQVVQGMSAVRTRAATPVEPGQRSTDTCVSGSVTASMEWCPNCGSSRNLDPRCLDPVGPTP